MKKGDFWPVENLLQSLPQSQWSLLADHLFQFCSESDPFPLFAWIDSCIRKKAGNLTTELDPKTNFYHMVIQRFTYCDEAVKFKLTLLEPFYEAAKRLSKKYEVTFSN